MKKNRITSIARKIFPHINIIFSAFFLTLLSIGLWQDQFVNSEVTRIFLWIFCFVLLGESIIIFIDDRRK